MLAPIADQHSPTLLGAELCSRLLGLAAWHSVIDDVLISLMWMKRNSLTKSSLREERVCFSLSFQAIEGSHGRNRKQKL